MKYLKRAVSIVTLLITLSLGFAIAQPGPDPNFCECPEGYVISPECENDCDQDPEACCVENTIPLQKSEANAVLIAAGLVLVCITYYRKSNKATAHLPHPDTTQGSWQRKLSKQTKHFFQDLFS